MVEYAYKENGVMKLKPVALSLSQAEIDEIATELLEAMQPDWQNAVAITAASMSAGYVVPEDGMIVGAAYSNTATTSYATVNDVIVGRSESGTNYLCYINVQCQVVKGDVFKITNLYPSTNISFIPFKTAAEPLTLPVNVMNNPSLPDWGRAVAITKDQLINGYTSPANGMIVGFVEPNVYSSNEVPTITINDVIITAGRSTSNEVTYANIQCPVGARDIIKLIDCTLAKVSSRISFVPFKN